MTKQVLLISRNSTIDDYFKQASTHNLNLVSLPNTVQGLKWLNNGNFPDLILINSINYEVEALELINQIRNRAVSDIPIILIAEEAQKLNINLFAKADSCLFKPFSIETLQKKILSTISPKYPFSQIAFNTSHYYPSLWVK